MTKSRSNAAVQAALDYGDDYRKALGRRELLDALEAALDYLKAARAAGACGARRQDLNDAIVAREGRHVHADWPAAIALECKRDGTPQGDALYWRIARAVMIPFDLEPAAPMPLSIEERAFRAEAALLSLGEIGEGKLREIHGGRLP